jgi:phosphoglycolate phosphatase-like HAD superfamily hydrolase
MSNMELAIIVDLDGTICNIKQRLHHIETAGLKKNWDAFNEDIPFDEPHNHVIDLVNIYKKAGYKILLVTGRFEKYSHYTTAWLAAHGVGWDMLCMRTDGDYRSDYVVKEEKWMKIIKDNYDVQFVLDDRDTVVDMWRRNGLKCFQVQKGDY